jgi:hypothetical protein
MPKNEPLSWEPVLDGKIYCAPACGHRCTKAAFDLATAAADKLCADLGPGWKPRMNENMGWYYSAVSPCGRWKVHPHAFGGDVSYTAFLGDAGAGGGYWAESGDTPQAAIVNAWKVAKAAINEWASFLSADPKEMLR